MNGRALPGEAVAAPPRVLIATTTWWGFSARIAMEFSRAGFRVSAICPSGHPLQLTRSVDRLFRYRALRPLQALRAAIQACRPDLIVPCDDRTVAHLHQLHAASPADPVGALIARSLGDPASFPILLDRSQFIATARAAGVRAPEMIAIRNEADLAPAIDRVGLPCMLKTDGTWGGLGTRLVTTQGEAPGAWRRAARRLSAARAIKRLLVDRDPFHLRTWLGRRPPAAGLQRLCAGQPANCIVACWQGEVLALTCVKVIASNGPLGAATIVHVIDHAEMAKAARTLVHRLRLSGFCGFDFLLDGAEGAAHLLEINPRSTPLCHLALGPGRDPVAALAARVSGSPPMSRAAVTNNDILAYFPQAWHRDPADPILLTAYHDVPWEEPDLLRELIRRPRPERGILVGLVRALRGLVAKWRGGDRVGAPQEQAAATPTLQLAGLSVS